MSTGLLSAVVVRPVHTPDGSYVRLEEGLRVVRNALLGGNEIGRELDAVVILIAEHLDLFFFDLQHARPICVLANLRPSETRPCIPADSQGE